MQYVSTKAISEFLHWIGLLAKANHDGVRIGSGISLKAEAICEEIEGLNSPSELASSNVYSWIDGVINQDGPIIIGNDSEGNPISLIDVMTEIESWAEPVKILSFNDLMKLSVHNMDERYRSDEKPEYIETEIPSYIKNNLLKGQRILFVSTIDKLEMIASAAICCQSQISIENYSTGLIRETDWPLLSSGVMKLKDKIPSQFMVVNEFISDEKVSCSLIEKISNDVDVVIMDKEINGLIQENIFKELNIPIYIRTFIESIHKSNCNKGTSLSAI